MIENNIMNVTKVDAYAVFVNGDFNSIYYHPSDGNELFIAMAAALQSNPTITFDGRYVENTNSYSVYVGQDFVAKLLLPAVAHPRDLEYIEGINYAFQNNPTIVWIDSETSIPRDTKYSYDGDTLTLIEE
jgi:hypothetical protein